MDGMGSFQRRVVQVERIRVQGSLTMYVILSFMLQVVKSPPRTSGSAPLRRVEIDLFRLHQKREPAELKKKKKEKRMKM